MRVWDELPAGLRERIKDLPENCEEVRVRLGQPIEVRAGEWSRLAGAPVEAEEMQNWLLEMTGHSLYAWERQLRDGYLTLPGGARVGATGVYGGEEGALNQVTSLSVRVAREMKGAADLLMPHLLCGSRPASLLLLSAPCMGKTTVLCDAVRQLSERGFRVAVADERGEISGSREGRTTMELGPRADVAVFCPKREANPRLVRAMSPDVIATDELGRAGDADAVRDAARCGVAVLATAHAGSYAQARARAALGEIIAERLFEKIVLLAGKPGSIAEIRDGGGAVLWNRSPCA